MQAVQLITITDYYLPLAGNGQNTIRKYQGKYLNLAVGDNVVMFHTRDAGTHEIIAQTLEFLRVSAIAVGSIDTICTHHAPKNHRWRFHDEISSFQHELRSFYPEPEPHVPDDGLTPNDGQYCAIYF